MPVPVYTAEQFRAALLQLLPRGRAWPKEEGSALFATAGALAPTHARAANRAGGIVAEAFPATTVELLSEWEKSLGLPDPCAGTNPTAAERRAQVVARFRAGGGQSVAALKQFAADLGFSVNIREFEVSRAGALRAGQQLVGNGAQFCLRVEIAQAATVRLFRVGSRAGEKLGTWNNSVLECEMLSVKPAHAQMVFSYAGAAAAPVVTPQPDAPAETSVVTVISQPVPYRVHQRNATTGGALNKGLAQVPVGISLSAAAPLVEFRLRDFNATATTLVDWAGIGARPAGAQTVTLNLPAADKWFIVDFRTNGDNATLASTTNRFGVGDIWLHGGQSQQVNNIVAIGQGQTGQTASALGLVANAAAAVNVFGDNGTPVSTGWGPLVPGGSAAQPSSPYLAEFTNRMVAASGVVTAVAGYAVGATTISQWDQPGDTLMQAAATMYAGIGAVAGYQFFLGGTDALSGTSKADFKSGLSAHWAAVKAAVSFPLGRAIDLVPMGARTAGDGAGGTEAQVEAIRQAALEWVVENNAEAGIAYGWPDVAIIADGLHQDGAGARTMGSRYALTAQKRLGLRAADARGPVLLSAARASNSANVVLSVQLNGGTGLVKRNAAAAVDGIEVYTAGTLTNWPVSAVNVGTASGGVVPVTVILATTPTNTVALDVVAPYGRDADSSAATDNLLYDNQSVPGSTLGLPLGGTSRPVTAAAPGAGSGTVSFPSLGSKLVWRMSAQSVANFAQSGGVVTAIKDVSGNAAADLAYTGDSGANATYVASGGAGNQPYLEFGTAAARGTAASDYSANISTVQNAISGAAQKFHIFSVTFGHSDATDSSAVFVVENTGSGGFSNHITHWQATNGSTQGLMLRGDPSNSGAVNNGGASSYNFTADAWHLLEGTYDGSQVRAFVDGAQQNGSDTATYDCGDAALTGLNATRIGSRTSGGTKARNLRGRLAEVIVCNDVLTAAERNSLVAWVNATYGLSAA